MKQFPIIAYMGVHDKPNNIKNYQQFADCGFTHSLWMFLSPGTDNLKQVKTACAMADRNGVKVIACSNSMFACPQVFATELQDVPGFGGYFITDEPGADKMEYWQDRYIKPIREIDNNHIIYINLLPSYGGDLLGTRTYDEYLEKSKVMDTTQVSFDFYPVTKDRFRVDEWYDNLYRVAAHSRAIGKSWWGFILSTAHGPYPVPTPEQLSIQAYTNLAFGAQGLQYFTYQTPEAVDGFVFKDGPIDVDYTTKTATWYKVRDLNRKLRNIIPIFNGATDFNVVRTNPLLWWSRVKDNVRPRGFDKIKVTGRDGAIISTFKNNGREYCAVVNSSYKDDVTLTINTTDYSRVNTDTIITTEEAVKSSYTLKAGGCMIFVRKKSGNTIKIKLQ